MPRSPGLDTLRAAAIVLVVASHARGILKWEWLQAPGRIGWAGVDLFFVLSGYLIAAQLLARARARGRVDFASFYARRAFRILPNYLVVLLLYALWPAFNEDKGIDPAWRFLSFTMNFGRTFDGFSHAWSLCVEEHFYLLFPLLAAFWLGKRRRVPPVFLLAGLVAGGMALRAGLAAGGAPFWEAIYRPTYCRLDGLLAGVALALAQHARPRRFESALRRPKALLVAGVALVAVDLWVYDGPKTAAVAAFAFPALAAGFALVVAAALAPGCWLARARIPGAAALAAGAYALYLTHKQMLHFATTLVPDFRQHPWETGVWAAGLTVGMAASLHFLVERPALRGYHRFFSRKDRHDPRLSRPPVLADAHQLQGHLGQRRAARGSQEV